MCFCENPLFFCEKEKGVLALSPKRKRFGPMDIYPVAKPSVPLTIKPLLSLIKKHINTAQINGTIRTHSCKKVQPIM